MSQTNLNALDLNTAYPRSPRVTVGGYVVAGRVLDKCRAVLAGTNGEYHFACPLDQTFFDFAGIEADAFKDFVATGADDEAVGKWIQENAKEQTREEVVAWNNQMRDTRISDMPIKLQVFLEDYIPECLPAGRVVYHWFDVYDIEEERI